MRKSILAVTIFLALVGCQQLKNAGVGEIPFEMIKNEHGNFRAELSLPLEIKVNEVITIEAELINESEEEVTIESRRELFVIRINDDNGRQINSYVVSDAGTHRIIPGKTTIVEPYTYKIKEPGIYEVIAIAQLSIDKNGKREQITIQTLPKKIQVIADSNG